MSKVPGVPLDRFLEWWQRERRPPADVGPGQPFSEACHFSQQLIAQLAPTFEHISSQAFHRDVNSHNILVQGGDVLVPSYGLVDFGLAADLKSWEGPGVSPSSWHLVDIGGDCRYWPMAAWLQFECGWQELAKYPALSAEYQTHLDLHALGITALQVWASMMNSAVQAKNNTEANAGRSGYALPQIGSARSPWEAEKLPEEVLHLHAAWEQYWQDATRFWERLLDCFRNSGDQNSLKGWCISEGVHNIIGQDLANLRTALREVVQICGPSASSGSSASGSSANAMFSGHRLLFTALLELVSAGGMSGFVEGQAKGPSWQAVRALLDESGRSQRQSIGGQGQKGYGQSQANHQTTTSYPMPAAVAASTVSPPGLQTHSAPITWRTSTSGAPTSLAQAAATGALAMPMNRAAAQTGLMGSMPATAMPIGPMPVSAMPLSVATYTAVQPGNRFAPFEPSPLQNSTRLPSYVTPTPTKVQTGGSWVGEAMGSKAATLH